MSFVNYNSALERKKWMREGLVQKAATSFWAGYTGMGDNSIVRQTNNTNAADGHTVVFDYDGNLAGKAVKGKETAFGKGEEKKKFSDKITVERFRLVVDNGDSFDGVNIGDLSITQHSDSRSKLGDLFIRWKDQTLFDAAQGLKDFAPSHIINLGTSHGYTELLNIEKILKMGSGFSTGGKRAPLQPFKLADGRPVWLYVMDPAMATMLKQSSNYQSLVYNADVRGNENRAIKGVFGKIGNLMLVEADAFFGKTEGATATWDIDANSVEIAGLRRKDANNVWTGQEGYLETGVQISRGLLLGNNALQIAFGKMPDYKFQASEDFGIKSESCLEVWMETQKTRLLAETKDYNQAKIAGIDFGVIAVDVQTQS